MRGLSGHEAFWPAPGAMERNKNAPTQPPFPQEGFNPIVASWGVIQCENLRRFSTSAISY